MIEFHTILYVELHFKMPIAPHLVTHKTKLKQNQVEIYSLKDFCRFSSIAANCKYYFLLEIA